MGNAYHRGATMKSTYIFAVLRVRNYRIMELGYVRPGSTMALALNLLSERLAHSAAAELRSSTLDLEEKLKKDKKRRCEWT